MFSYLIIHTLVLPDTHQDTKLSRSHELELLTASYLLVLVFPEPSTASIQNAFQVAKNMKDTTEYCLTNKFEGI